MAVNLQNIVSMSDIEEALQLFYLEGMRYQLNEETSAFLAQIEKTTENVEGWDIVMALRYGRSGGIGNLATDASDLPRPNARKTKQAKWQTKNLAARFMLTDKTIEASKTNVASFARQLETQIRETETDAAQDLSRQVMTDEYGLLAKIDEDDSSKTTWEVDSVQFLVEGMQVDIYAGSADSIRDSAECVEIVAVEENEHDDDEAPTITLAESKDLEDGDEIFVYGNRESELFGVSSIFDNDEDIYGLDRSTYPWLKAQIYDIADNGSNQDLSQTDLQKAIDGSAKRTGAEIDFIMCSFGVKRSYQALLTSDRRYHNTMELEGGWQVLDYNGIPLVADKYMHPNKMFLLDLSDWAMYQMSDWKWLDMDGSMFSRVADKAAFEATLIKYCDIGCEKPRGQVMIEGIKEY